MKELINIQSELKAPKNQRNNFGKYNYRSCEDVLEALKPLLKKHECTLTITDLVCNVGELTFIEAKATITNSEGVNRIVTAQAGINPNRKGMDIAQIFGSSSSYARKYALNGLFLIDDSKEIDSLDNSKTEAKKKLTLEQFKATLSKGTKEQIEKVINTFELEYEQLKQLKEKIK